LIYRENVHVPPKLGPRVSVDASRARLAKMGWKLAGVSVGTSLVGLVVVHVSMWLVFANLGVQAFVAWRVTRNWKLYERLAKVKARKRFNRSAHVTIAHVDYDHESQHHIIEMARESFFKHERR
jgi:hypothetical protein